MTAQCSGFDIRLLGPLRVTYAGQELTLRSAQRRAVFTALALTPQRGLSKDELIAAVWGDRPPASAQGNLYTYVSALRRVLEPDRDRWSSGGVLTSEGGGYRLHVAADAVDVHRFERLRERARTPRAAGDVAGELAALDAALAEWRGDEALVGVPGPRAASQRVRLGELYLTSVERRAELMLGLGRAAEVVDRLLSLVERHPGRESLYAVTMRALAAQGRTADARALYATLRDRLVAESGTEPGAAVRQIHEQMLGTDPTATRGHIPAPPSLPGFQGRTAALARLRQAVTALAAGRGGSVWISGEAGIGKSALLAEGLRDAAPLGVQVGWGVGDELAYRMPLSIMLECLSLGDDAGLPASLHDCSGGAPPTMTVVDTVQRFVVARCAERPLLLVLDDLQWADDLSLLVWHALHNLTGRLPLLLVSACRPVPAGYEVRLLRRVLPRNGTALVELGPLDDDTATRLARSWTRPPGPGADTVRALVAAAAGNPFYLRQLVLADRDGRTADTPGPELTEAVNRHLQPLADDTRQLLRAIAFLGNNYLVTDLAAVTGKSAPQLVPAVEEALAAGVLVEDGRRLRFRHPVIRRVLRGAIPTALRVLMHRQFAQRIAEAGGDLGRVAGQLLAGPVPVDAWVQGWLTAHAAQLSAAAPAPAIAVLRHAVASPGLSASSRELLTAQLARVLHRCGLPARAEAIWVSAHTGDAATRAEMSRIAGSDDPPRSAGQAVVGRS
ncbi:MULTISPECIES: BTAD domain-containing putative transcriptional regulator [Micromonospora]|uniref:Transcriptional regulator n=1 Tax=Micromonospora chalcea TaxID=1874 RepID=A0ABX9Y9Y1_MICCH|nr:MULTISPECIES: BTAD domain-containing putative transcriptional regulator [Micromonospora]ODB72542.1 transcriptional regulator [Micromonospora sp. II]RQW96973.1 transcriptional regulator [Micromonospora chalcea]